MGLVNWLKKRLSPVKRDIPRWQELSEAIEEFWAAQFDPEYLKTLNLRSIYSASEADQIRMIAELGQYFEQDTSPDNRAMVVAMRKLELFQKETSVPMRNYMQRHGISGIEWSPLYALSSDVYGTKFYTEKELLAAGITPGTSASNRKLVNGTWKLSVTLPVKLSRVGNYMTSRGKLVFDLTKITDSLMLTALRDHMKSIKPLHIVFDGYYCYLGFELLVSAITQYSALITKTFDQAYSWPASRLDGKWKVAVAAQKQLKTNIEVMLGCVKSVESDFSHLERLGKPLRALGALELKRLDGSWKVGNPMTGRWRLDGKRHIAATPLGRRHSKARLNGSWWLGSTKRLDGGWKVGRTLTTVTAESRIYIRKVGH